MSDSESIEDLSKLLSLNFRWLSWR